MTFQPLNEWTCDRCSTTTVEAADGEPGRLPDGWVTDRDSDRDLCPVCARHLSEVLASFWKVE